MARSIDSRLARLEAPRGDLPQLTARHYARLQALHGVLSHLTGEPMPDDTELWAMAQAEAVSGRAPDYTAALQAVWDEEANR